MFTFIATYANDLTSALNSAARQEGNLCHIDSLNTYHRHFSVVIGQVLRLDRLDRR